MTDTIDHGGRNQFQGLRGNENCPPRTNNVDDSEREAQRKWKEDSYNTLQSIPQIAEYFQDVEFVDKGAFGAVYKARPTAKAVQDDPEFAHHTHVALKHLFPFVEVGRRRDELHWLRRVLFEEHMAKIIDIVRHEQEIVAVLEYVEHDNLKDLIADFTVEEAREYMRALLTALAALDRLGIIHHDIKPANFLYCRRSRKCALVDFGLATAVDESCKERLEELKTKYHEERRRIRKRAGAVKGPVPAAANEQRRNKLETKDSAARYADSVSHKRDRMASVLAKGFLKRKDDGRPHDNGQGNGTRGFRPPEAVMHYPTLGTIGDMYSAGVIMLCIVAGHYPVFTATDEYTALLELIYIHGWDKVKRTADLLHKDIAFSKAEQDGLPRHGVNLETLCEESISRVREQLGRPVQAGVNVWPKDMYAVLKCLLEINPVKRPTAAEVLEMPFFASSEPNAKLAWSAS